MATVTVLTAERMLEIEANSIVGAAIIGDDLIFTKQDGSMINAGPVLVLTASNNTQYRLVVSNTGTLSTVAI